MAAPLQWFDGPSFDLGIAEDSENLSPLNVEDGETSHVQDVISHHDDEGKAKKTESSSGIESGASVGKFKHDFDLNKVPKETVSPMDETTEIEENVKSSKVKNLRQKIVQPYERGFLDLNRSVLDLNKFPDDGLDFGFESEELNKGVHNMLKIYLDSSY